MDVKKYQSLLEEAVKVFWQTRHRQAQGDGETKDRGNRSAVTGGRQMDGFLKLLGRAATDLGIPERCVHVRGNQLPGYFRATKDWDMLIVTPSKKLVVAIELKSQVGSFGNNFNNRTEEALGSATDLWTAFREKAFPDQLPPWLGYLMVIEKSARSTAPVRISEPFYKVFEEFRGTSYMERYKLFCEKLIRGSIRIAA